VSYDTRILYYRFTLQASLLKFRKVINNNECLRSSVSALQTDINYNQR